MIVENFVVHRASYIRFLLNNYQRTDSYGRKQKEHFHQKRYLQNLRMMGIDSYGKAVLERLNAPTAETLEGRYLNFAAFDTEKLDTYASQAKA